jgi:hypothetical protein
MLVRNPLGMMQWSGRNVKAVILREHKRKQINLPILLTKLQVAARRKRKKMGITSRKMDEIFGDRWRKAECDSTGKRDAS